MKYIFLLIISFFPLASFSAYHQSEGFGGVASNLMGPANFAAEFVGLGSLVAGCTFLFGALIRFRQYRINHIAMPLSTVITLFVLGLVLVIIGLAYKVFYLQ
jgi:hypothetical protein